MTTELRYVCLGLLDIGAVKFGSFRLRLHETHPDAPLSPIYIDLRLIRSFPWLLRNIAGLMGRKVAAIAPRFIADVPTAATPLASVMAVSFDLPMLTPRAEQKTHGVRSQIEGAPIPGSTVVVVDDLITHAESKLGAIALLRAAELIVSDVVVFLDREQGGKEQLAAAGCSLHSVIFLSEMLDFYVSEHRIEHKQRTAIDDYISQMDAYRNKS